MKVTKIDFITELMEIPDGRMQMRFVKYSPLMYAVQSFEAGAMDHPGICEDLVYRVEKVRTPDGHMEYYLIKDDEKQLAEQLFLLSDLRLERLFRERTVDLVEKAKRFTENRIRTLAWWKRLFNKF